MYKAVKLPFFPISLIYFFVQLLTVFWCTRKSLAVPLFRNVIISQRQLHFVRMHEHPCVLSSSGRHTADILLRPILLPVQSIILIATQNASLLSFFFLPFLSRT